MSKKESQADLPKPNVRSLNKGSKLDASNNNADTYRRVQVSVPPRKLRDLSLVSLPKRNEVRTPTVRSSSIAGQSQQSKPTRLSKDHAVSIKGEFQKTVGNRDPPAVPIRRKVIQKTAVPNDPTVPTQSRVVQETANPDDLVVPIQRRMTQKAAIPKDAPVSTQRRGILESSGPKNPAVPITSSGIKKTLAPETHAPSIRWSGSAKTSAPRQVSHKKTKKTQLSPSQSEPSSELTDPVHHITWDGWDEKCEPLGQSCYLCDKDFSCAPQHDDQSNYEDQFENYDAPKPLMLPAVDILPCGHAVHSECLQFSIPEEQSSDPPCFLCMSMA